MAASGEIAPTEFPPSRTGAAALRVGFTSAAIGAPTIPELTRIDFDVSSDVALQYAGLPSCSLDQLYSVYGNARETCARSFVGHGWVTSEIALPGQAPAIVTGHLLAFYAFAEAEPHVLAQVITGEPLSLIYVIPFRIDARGGPFGTRLIAAHMPRRAGICTPGHPYCFAQPYAFKGIYGHISDFTMSLHRRFAAGGKKWSFVSARCPGRTRSQVTLLRTRLFYAGGARLTAPVEQSCTAAPEHRGEGPPVP